MKKNSNYQAESLGEWIVVATFELIAPASERIKLEIEAHYAEAVALRVAEGWNPTDAEAATLLELGDPMDAARSFRKRHLTKDDEKWMRRLAESTCRLQGRGRWAHLIVNLIVFIALLCGLVCLVSKDSRHEPLRFLLSLQLGLNFVMLVNLFLVPNLLVRPSSVGPEFSKKAAFI